MGILDDIKNAILSFFQALASFLVNILITIKDKLLDFISWLINGLWSLFLSIFNKVKDTINSLFVKPLTDFTNRVLNRFYQKIDGMMMILVGVPLTWKAVENFINDPTKKRLLFIPLALAFSWFLSKIVGQVIRQFMSRWISQGISLPGLPSASVPKMPSIVQSDNVLQDIITFRKIPTPYFTDMFMNDKLAIKTNPLNKFTLFLLNDSLTSSLKTSFINKISVSDSLSSDSFLKIGDYHFITSDRLSSDLLKYLMSLHIYKNLTDNISVSDILTSSVRPYIPVSPSDTLTTDSLTYSYPFNVSGKTAYSDETSANIYVRGIPTHSDNTSAVLYAYDKITYSDTKSGSYYSASPSDSLLTDSLTYS
jgi:hypothetical protein